MWGLYGLEEAAAKRIFIGQVRSLLAWREQAGSGG